MPATKTGCGNYRQYAMDGLHDIYWRKVCMTGIETLLNGFRKFREMYFEKSPGIYQDLVSHGQNPRFAVVACSDSRVDPAIVLQTEPGDIFSVRNVAALVPPYEEDRHYHGTAAMVHSQEGGPAGGKFISAWTNLLREARSRALAAEPKLDGDALLRASECQSVQLSLENLATFPFVREAMEAGNLNLHGWYLNIFEGALEIWNPDTGTFERLS
jgi:carbonic anhydrase